MSLSGVSTQTVLGRPFALSLELIHLEMVVAIMRGQIK